MIEKIKKMLPGLVQNPGIVPILLDNIPKKNIYLVQEGKLLFGTKQRAIVLLIKENMKLNPKIKTVLYVASHNGSGSGAISYGAWKCGLAAICIIVCKTEENLTWFLSSKNRAALLATNAKIIITDSYGDARTQADKIRNKSPKDSIFYPEMGFNSELWRNLLSSQLRIATKKLNITSDTTIWITSGTGSIAMALYQAYPNANFGLYLMGSEKYNKIIYDWIADKPGIIVIPPIPLEKDPHVPYPTVANYDDQIYRYISEFAEDGDIIWNIATDSILV